ncbi:MAG TPA: hypothetical protein ENJ53_09140 [Phaeodactylibacter sp.]|nr:hypothetical protein [Phaeodactylibacter sp.]
MSQFNWTYLAPSGKKHHIGLFHGDRTGHVVIHCNSKVVLIDFKVFETKSYSIFIEEELCEIGIERQNGHFAYGFDIDKEVDTPLNRERKATNKKHLTQVIGFVGGLALLVFIASLFLGKLKKEEPSLAALLAASSKETKAQVFVSNPTQGRYDFVANGRVYSKKRNFNVNMSALLENGMPLEDGDEFLVKYSTQRPEYHKVLFNRPTPHQVEIYRQRATKKHLELHPNETLDYCDCLTQIAYEKEGIKGYAKFYLQDRSIVQNPEYNSNSFHRLVRSIPFKEEVKKRCWDK